MPAPEYAGTMKLWHARHTKKEQCSSHQHFKNATAQNLGEVTCEMPQIELIESSLPHAWSKNELSPSEDGPI